MSEEKRTGIVSGRGLVAVPLSRLMAIRAEAARAAALMAVTLRDNPGYRLPLECVREDAEALAHNMDLLIRSGVDLAARKDGPPEELDAAMVKRARRVLGR